MLFPTSGVIQENLRVGCVMLIRLILTPLDSGFFSLQIYVIDYLPQ